MKFLKTITVALAVMAAGTSFARETKTIVLDMDDRTFRDAAIIDLKTEIEDQDRSIRIKDYDLEEVIMVAKSRGTNARVTLEVGGRRMDSQRIDRGAFDSYTFLNRSNAEDKAWELKMTGDIQVREIEVTLVPLTGGIGADWEFLTCESNDFERERCYPRSRGDIVEVQIEEVFSSRLCIQDINWGFTASHVWVDGGCRAEFRVKTAE